MRFSSCDTLIEWRCASLSLRLLGLVACLGISLGATRLSAQEDSRSEDPLVWIEELENRRLYRLAGEALEAVALRTNDSALRRRVRVRQLRVETAWAVESAVDEREAHWQQIATLAQLWLDGAEDPRDLALIGVQAALAPLAKAEVLREEDLGGASRDPASSAAALEAIDEARKKLAEIDRLIPTWMSQRLPQGDEPWEASAWLSLSRNINFHLARCALERGHWYEKELDRLEAYQDAAQRLDEVARQTAADETLAWHTILARCRALREIGDLENAARVLIPPGTQVSDEAWLTWLDGAPPELRARLVAERIRLAERAKLVDEAARWAVRGVEGQFGRSAELDLAILERLLARWEAEKVEELESQAAAWARRIEQEHGPYWGRRAARTVVAKASQSGAGNLDVVMSVADERTLQRRFPEAIQGYQTALTAARERGNTRLEILAHVRLGAVYQATGEHLQAATHFGSASELAIQEPEQPRYAWLAIWNRLQAIESEGIEADPGDVESVLLAYEQQYPERPEASEARVARVARLLRRGKTLEALEGALAASASDPAQEKLSSLMTACVELLLRANTADPDALTQRRQAADLLEKACMELEAASSMDPPSQLQHLRLAVIWARVLSTLPAVDAPTQRAQMAIAQIDRLLAADGDLFDDELRRQAQLVAAVLAATLPPSDSMWEERSKAMGQADAESLLEAMESLSARLRELDAERRRQVATFALVLIEKADSQGPDATRGLRRERCRVEILLAAGRDDEAIATLRDVLIALPRDGEVQRWGARQWAEAGPEHREGAIDQWRRVVARTPPRTDDWFEGKYRIAELTLASGDASRALELLRYLKETPPGWEDAPQRDSFERLLKDAERAAPGEGR